MKLLWLLCVLSFSTVVYSGCRQLSPEMFALLEKVMDEIYHLDTQDIQQIVQQDFGCIPSISLQDLLAKQQQANLLIVNVLSEKWYRDCHIAGSINVPLDKLIYLMEEYDRSTEIVVYCALDECDASEKAYVLLKCMGFEQVVDYRGGIKEWFQAGYPIEGACVSSYLHDLSANRFDCNQPDDMSFDFCAHIKRSLIRRRSYSGKIESI